MRYISYYSYTIVSKFVAHIKKTLYSTKLRSRLIILFFLLLLLKSQLIQNPVEKNSSSFSLCLFFPVVSVALSLSLSLISIVL